MKDELVFYVFAIGGIAILLSYYLIYVSGSLGKLFPILTKNKTFYNLWLLSVLITIPSILYIIVYYSFYERFDDNIRTLFIVSIFVYLFFCLCWPITVEYIVRNPGTSPEIQRPVLLVVALATLGFFLSVVLNDVNNALLIAAGVIVVFHHFVFDSVLWVNLHNNTKKLRK